MNKLCKKCETVKPSTEFSNDKKSKDGLQYHCKACNAAYSKANAALISKRAAAYLQKNKSARYAYQRNWRENNAEKIAKQKLDAQRSDKVAYHLRHAKWRERNASKVKAWSQAYAKSNLSTLAARAALRRATKIKATPPWANVAKIAEFYVSSDALGMLTGEWYHVDHIVPLQSNIVCGLHNEFNLQILPAKTNQSKSNLIWPDMPL